MTVLNVVVADLLIGQGLVRLGELDVVVVERLDGLILGRIGLDLVGMELEGKALVVSLDVFLGGGLEEKFNQFLTGE